MQRYLSEHFTSDDTSTKKSKSTVVKSHKYLILIIKGKFKKKIKIINTLYICMYTCRVNITR